MTVEQQRAELFKHIDQILAWQKIFNMKQMEQITWKASVIKTIEAIESTAKTTLQGCEILIQTDTQLNIRVDQFEKRIDIVNKRIRRIEDAVARLTPI